MHRYAIVAFKKRVVRKMFLITSRPEAKYNREHIFLAAALQKLVGDFLLAFVCRELLREIFKKGLL